MKYKNPSSVVDLIVERDNEILLVKRKREPFKNMWALPGGFIDYGKETLEGAGVRELWEETGLRTGEKDLELLGVYSSPTRDPRGHVISHAYRVNKFEGEPKAKDDAKETRFFPKNNLPNKLAFDHEKILEDYEARKNV